MARADLLLNLVKAGINGERELFTKTVEAVIAEERSKSHHVLADSLASAASQAKLFVAQPAAEDRAALEKADERHKYQ